MLHFVSHPSPLTPGLRNGLKWNEQVELEIPQLDQRITDPDARDLIKALLRRDPVKRGSASYWMVSLMAHGKTISIGTDNLSLETPSVLLYIIFLMYHISIYTQ